MMEHAINQLHVMQDTTCSIPKSHRKWYLSESPMECETSLYVSPRCARSLGACADAFSATSFDTFSSDDWAVCIIKPDAKERDMSDRIHTMIRSMVPRVRLALTLENLSLTRSNLDEIWPAPLNSNGDQSPPSEWWGATVEYMMSAPVDIHLIHGVGATAALLEIKSVLRTELYGEGYQNDLSRSMEERVTSVIHTSDCDRELVGNSLAFWSHTDIRNVVAAERKQMQ